MKNPSVLIVDDEDRWRDLLEKLLCRAGYDCRTAGSSQEAIEMLTVGSYKVAIVDIRLTDAFNVNDVGGIDIVNWLRCTRAETKAILVTAYPAPEVIRDAFRSGGVVDFFFKGNIDPGEFVSCVGKILKCS